MSAWQAFCSYVSYPAWDLKDGLGRLREYRTLLRTQHWSAEQIAQQQLARLRAMVEYAYDHCEFYRRAWGTRPHLQQLQDLQRLPILSKKDLGQHGEQLVSSGFPAGALVAAKTGGSTGVATRVYFDVDCQKARNAAAMRSDFWAGWRPGMLTASLWGTPPIPKTAKEKIRNALHDRVIYLDTMRLDPQTMDAFVAQMTAGHAQALFGHAHSLFIFARYLLETGAAIPKMSGIISTSMMLLENERQVIERAFACPVSNRYGCEEVGLIASECERHEGLHLNSEHVVVEFLRGDDSPAAPGEEGRIVVTDLMNHGMPLIRYEVGDLGVPSARRCSCGRGLPLMERLTGRTADFLKRRDGALVAGVSLVEKTLTAIHGIEQMQIVQTRLDSFVINVVPKPEFDSTAADELRQVMLDAFGEGVQVEINRTDSLPQERNSKYRFSICRV